STRYGAMVGPRLPKLNFLALATSITTTSSCNRSKSRLNARVTVDIDLLLTQLAHPTRHHGFQYSKITMMHQLQHCISLMRAYRTSR
ncbi:hypothetical protein JI435_071210, partial [Parastagonospora nodorum SN15]